MASTKQAPSRLDVRSLPLAERHGPILSALEALTDGATLTVVTDFEPRPLRLKLELLFPEQYLFGQRHFGIAHWEITLRRVPVAPGMTPLGAFLRRCAALADAGARIESVSIEHVLQHNNCSLWKTSGAQTKDIVQRLKLPWQVSPLRGSLARKLLSS